MSGFRRGLMAAASVDPLKVPLTFTAEEAGSTVALNDSTVVTEYGTVHYRMGKSGLWIPYTAGEVITLENVGDSVQFWNNYTQIGEYKNLAHFYLTGKISASGNIQSLCNWSSTVGGRMEQLFSGQLALVSAPLLPGTRITDGGVYMQMFERTSIKIAPEIHLANTKAAVCHSMYRSCISLEKAVINLSPDTVYSGEYNFYCMFQYCPKLAHIEVNFTSWELVGGADFAYWVDGVASEGVFIKPAALPEEYGVNRIPTGWTVVNID